MRQTLTILLVDDDEDFRDALVSNLRDDGHTIRAHADTSEVRTIEDIRLADVLITDYQMPGEDGIAFVKRVHEMHSSLPAIIVSAHWAPALDNEIAKLQFVSFIATPLDYAELSRLLEQVAVGPAPSH